MTARRKAKRAAGRHMGVDLGTRRIGIALSDDAGTVATPYTVLDRSSDERDAAAIAEIARGEDVVQIVLGLPLTLAGERGDAAMVVEAFAQRLTDQGLAVHLLDERLTTAQADKSLGAAGVRGRKRRQVVDKVAASVILQSYLDGVR